MTKGLGSKRRFGTPSEVFVVGLLEELKQFIDGTETYRSLEARLVTTTSLGAVEELFVLLEGCSYPTTKTGVPNRRLAFGHLLAEPQAPNVEQPIEEF